MKDLVIIDQPAPVASATLDSRQFHIKGGANAFKVLSTDLYSLPYEAVLREYSTNADDAGGGQFEVKLPTRMDPSFYIKDWGTGLDHESVMTLFGGYFESTKGDTNAVTGKFGLGSKVYATLADSCTLIVSHGGKRRVYMAFKEQGCPKIALRSEEDIAEDDTWQHGIQVSIPVGVKDFDHLARASAGIFAWFPLKPRILGASVHVPEYTATWEGSDVRVAYTVPAEVLHPLRIGEPPVQLDGRVEKYGFQPSIRAHGNPHVTAVMGPVAYPVKVEELGLAQDDITVLASAGMVMFVPMGAVDITPSRESLSYSGITRAYLKAAVTAVCADFRKQRIAEMRDASKAGALSLFWALKDACGYSSKLPQQVALAAGKSWVERGLSVPFDGTEKFTMTYAVVSQSRRASNPSVKTVKLATTAEDHRAIAGVVEPGMHPRPLFLSSRTPAKAYVVDSRNVLGALRHNHAPVSSREAASLFLVTPKEGVTVADALAAAKVLFDDLGVEVSQTSLLPLPVSAGSSSTSSGGAKGGPRAKPVYTLPMRRYTDKGRENVEVDIDDDTEVRYYIRELQNGYEGFEWRVSDTRISYTSSDDVLSIIVGLRDLCAAAGVLMETDVLHVVDVKTASRLERRAHWVNYADEVNRILGSFPVLEFVKEHDVLGWNDLSSSKDDDWLVHHYRCKPELQEMAQSALAGTAVLQILQRGVQASTEEKQRISRALFELSLLGFLNTVELDEVMLRAATLTEQVSKQFPLYAALHSTSYGHHFAWRLDAESRAAFDALMAMVSLWSHRKPTLVHLEQEPNAAKPSKAAAGKEDPRQLHLVLPLAA